MQSIFYDREFELASRYLADFSHVLRQTITHSGEIFNAIDNEILYLESYLSLEQIKRNYNLQFHINVLDNNIRKYFMPSMVMQPVIQNCLKHGIKDKQNGIITIEFGIIDNQIKCSIKDNGVGFGNSKSSYSTSKGRELIQEKLDIIERITNIKINLISKNSIDDNNNILGTESIFTFPILTTNIKLDESSNH